MSFAFKDLSIDLLFSGAPFYHRAQQVSWWKAYEPSWFQIESNLLLVAPPSMALMLPQWKTLSLWARADRASRHGFRLVRQEMSTTQWSTNCCSFLCCLRSWIRDRVLTYFQLSTYKATMHFWNLTMPWMARGGSWRWCCRDGHSHPRKNKVHSLRFVPA